MKHLGSWAAAASLLSLTFVLSGCGSSNDGPPVVPAEGTVTLDGKALPKAEVMFEPTGKTLGQAVFAKTDAEGKFVLGTPDGKRKGATVGEFRVVINKLVKPDGSDFVPDPNAGPMDTGGFRELLLPVYSDNAKSQLTASVPEGGSKTLEFKLKSKGR